MRLWAIVVCGLMSGMVSAQTNRVEGIKSFQDATVSNMPAWNFVVDAKHLTREERVAYNAKANCAFEMQKFGLGNVNMVRIEVEALESLREIQKCATNLPVRWLASPVVESWEKVGSNTWENVAGRIMGKFSPPEIEIGLRSDGVVVWRKKEGGQ